MTQQPLSEAALQLIIAALFSFEYMLMCFLCIGVTLSCKVTRNNVLVIAHLQMHSLSLQ